MELSSYSKFYITLENNPLKSKKTLKKRFYKMVDKNDYLESEKHQILIHLINIFF